MGIKIALGALLGIAVIAPVARAIDITEFPVSRSNISSVRVILDVIQHPFAESRESSLIAKDIESYCKTRAKGTSDEQIAERLAKETKGFSRQSRDRVYGYQAAITAVARSVCPQFR
ncbi:hypothetical protein [Leptolyngbya sp. NIES-2104]|uniref:hypothetical protein n=1 Tax=Leptolyngbya sp. NIES-2104 TaxID=1552121 RepID=UPI0006ECA0B0|nr:hypothetical protein [Leptolyngbya sp. NIES-2104]GAP96088.1 hypothetical protein NIES2104_26230 [Leptolyngbya sp. NIES-2104]